MKRFTRIMLLLSAVFIASGCLFCFIGTALGGQVSDVFDNVYLDTGKGRLVVSGQGISKTDFTRRCAGVKSLEIDAGLADCTVIRSAVSEVRITGNSSGNGPEMFQEDGTLYITQESGMSIPLFGDGTNAENIRIEIPEDLVLEKLWIHNGLGNTVVQEISCESLVLENGLGNITFTGSVEKEGRISNSMGQTALTLTGERDDYNYELSCGFGSLSVDGSKYSGIDLKENIHNGSNRILQADCSFGNISIRFREEIL